MTGFNRDDIVARTACQSRERSQAKPPVGCLRTRRDVCACWTRILPANSMPADQLLGAGMDGAASWIRPPRSGSDDESPGA